MAHIDIRKTTPDDIPLVLDFVRLLAAHERRPEAVVATEAGLHDLLFGARPVAHGLLGFLDGKPVAYGLMLERYSSFRAIRILYIEDILVTDAARGHGFGKLMMKHIAELALEMGCKAMEWSAVEDNELAKGFYRHLGFEPEGGRIHYDTDLAGVERLAGL
ncbi:MAG: GNAT family N-acetyltransferase [Alphaproteobacteria bacterium]|nr:MAG: GNAT family N-acetyltransferase [Alphaproteobacteria bacterium]